jgi:uncharacterized phage protein gp47/JayE
MAGLAHHVLRYIDWLSLQFLPLTSELEWLDRHAQIWLGGRKPASAAVGSGTITGTPGAILARYAQAEITVNLVTYVFETTEDATIDETGAGSVNIRSLTPGSGGNLDPDTPLNLINETPGIDGAIITTGTTGGTDVERDEDLRQRVLLRIRQPPMGGAAHDYVQWTLAVPGVTRAWCAPLEQGMGTVTVRFMCDDLRATDDPLTNGFPLQEDIDRVSNYLDSVRPVAVKDFFVVSPIPEPIDFRVTNLIDDTNSTRGAIEVSVDQMLREKAAPAYSLGGMLQSAQTIYETWVSCAILDAPGVEHFDLIMNDHEMPSNGSLAVRGVIAWG